MPSGRPTDHISLAYAIHCMLSGDAFDTDAAKQTIQHQFPPQDPAFERLLRDLMDAKIWAFGTLSVVDVDLPALEGHIVSDDVLQACLNWRQKGEIIIASGNETETTKVPPEAWWSDGVVWEQSILRVNNPDQFEERALGLTVERQVPYLPERPYAFERAICFVDIKFCLEDFVTWSNAARARIRSTRSQNPRNAGMDPTEDYPKIEDQLWQLVRQGREWQKWSQVWGDVRNLFVDPEDIERKYPTQPDTKLRSHLRRNRPELYEALRARIASVARLRN